MWKPVDQDGGVNEGPSAGGEGGPFWPWSYLRLTWLRPLKLLSPHVEPFVFHNNDVFWSVYDFIEFRQPVRDVFKCL